MKTAGFLTEQWERVYWQSGSHDAEAFLLWFPLIKASFVALFKKPLFKTTICGGPNGQHGGRMGHTEGHHGLFPALLSGQSLPRPGSH